MSNALIRKAFETRLKVWAAAQVPAMPVAYENAPFTPPVPTAANAAGRYARAYLLTGSTDSRDLEGKHREYVGVFQVTLVLGLNRGSKEAQDLEASLDLAFPTGLPLAQDGFNVTVTKPMSAGPASPESNVYSVPVSCQYKAVTFLSP